MRKWILFLVAFTIIYVLINRLSKKYLKYKIYTKNDSGAAYKLALYYIKKDKKDKYLKLIKKAAEMGNDAAQNDLGTMYSRGFIVEKNEVKAVEIYKLSALQGNSIAQYNLAWYYFHIQHEPEISLKWLEKSADSEYGPALVMLGKFYSDGVLFNKDYEKAFKLYHEAVKKEEVTAYHNLAILYFNGRGTKKDELKAFKLMEKAAKKRYVNAQYKLGMIYENGWGITKNFKKALVWYKKAFKQGKTEAEINIKKIEEKI